MLGFGIWSCYIITCMGFCIMKQLKKKCPLDIEIKPVLSDRSS